MREVCFKRHLTQAPWMGTLVGVALALFLMTSRPLQSATPSSGSVSSASPSAAWCGGAGCSDKLTGASTAQTGGSDCGNSPCDNFTLTIGSVNKGYQVTLTIAWTNPLNDFDLYGYDRRERTSEWGSEPYLYGEGV